MWQCVRVFLSLWPVYEVLFMHLILLSHVWHQALKSLSSLLTKNHDQPGKYHKLRLADSSLETLQSFSSLLQTLHVRLFHGLLHVSELGRAFGTQV